MDFETVILEKVKMVNPQAQASFFNGTLFIVTDNAVCTGDVYKIVDVLEADAKAFYPNCELKTARCGDEIAIDFA